MIPDFVTLKISKEFKDSVQLIFKQIDDVWSFGWKFSYNGERYGNFIILPEMPTTKEWECLSDLVGVQIRYSIRKLESISHPV